MSGHVGFSETTRSCVVLSFFLRLTSKRLSAIARVGFRLRVGELDECVCTDLPRSTGDQDIAAFERVRHFVGEKSGR